MYSIAVKRDFIANHFLIGGDWGRENQPHAHHYVFEVSIEHTELDQHGYLVDIVDIESVLTLTVEYFQNRLLNDLPEFSGLNPSLEHFCRIIWQKLLEGIKPPGAGTLCVKLWENDSCWASYQKHY